MTRPLIFGTLALFVLSSSSRISAQTVGYVGDYAYGTVDDVCADGNLLYVIAGGNLFYVLEHTGPSSFVDRFKTRLVGHFSRIKRVDDYLYLYRSDLGVIDISNPTQPVMVFTDDDFEYTDFDVQGSIGCAVGANTGFRALDLSSPAAPVPLDEYRPPGGTAYYAVAMNANTAYVAERTTSSAAIRIGTIDVSDPSSIVLGTFELLAYDFCHDLFWRDGELDVGLNNTMTAVTIPPLTQLATWSWSPYSYNRVGEYDVFSTIGGVHVLLGGTDLGSTPLDGVGWTGSSVSGTTLYRAAWEAGIEVLDVTDPEDITQTEQFHRLHMPVGIEIDDSRFFAFEDKRMLVFDRDVPIDQQQPLVLQGTFDQTEIHDGWLYTTGPNLELVDLSDPGYPRLLTHIPLPNTDIEIQGDILYASDSYGDLLHVIDVREPFAIFQYASIPHAIADGALIATSATHLYLLDEGIVDIFDLSDPTAPTFVTSFSSGPMDGIQVEGDNLYMNSRLAGLTIYSLADPLNPVQVGQIQDFVWSFQVRGNIAALAAGYAGTSVFDVSDPSAPTLIAGAPWAGWSERICYDEDRVYTMQDRIGVFEYEVDLGPTGVEPIAGDLVLGSYPNPARGRAQIFFSTPRSGTATLKLYDLAGRLVHRWRRHVDAGGRETLSWNGRDASGETVASGVYVLRMEAPGGAGRSHRIVWMR
jgi:hypothetical protein